jgi:hypothetical protein
MTFLQLFSNGPVCRRRVTLASHRRRTDEDHLTYESQAPGECNLTRSPARDPSPISTSVRARDLPIVGRCSRAGAVAAAARVNTPQPLIARVEIRRSFHTWPRREDSTVTCRDSDPTRLGEYPPTLHRSSDITDVIGARSLSNRVGRTVTQRSSRSMRRFAVSNRAVRCLFIT